MFDTDLWREIFQSINKNRTRSLLSGFTVTFAILLFTILFGLANGLNNTFAEAFAKEKAPVFDVRKNGEYRSEHLENAQNTPLDFINQHLPDFPKKGVFYLHCAGGYRSVIAGAILKKRGIHNLINVEGGFKAIKETDLPLTDYLCPSTF